MAFRARERRGGAGGGDWKSRKPEEKWRRVELRNGSCKVQLEKAHRYLRNEDGHAMSPQDNLSTGGKLRKRK